MRTLQGIILFFLVFFSSFSMASNPFCTEGDPDDFTDRWFPFLEYSNKILAPEFKEKLMKIIESQLNVDIEHFELGDVSTFISDADHPLLTNESLGINHYAPFTNVNVPAPWDEGRLHLIGYKKEVENFYIDLAGVNIFCEKGQLSSAKASVKVSISTHASAEEAQAQKEKYIKKKFDIYWDVKNDQLDDSPAFKPVVSCEGSNWKRLDIYQDQKNENQYLVKMENIPYRLPDEEELVVRGLSLDYTINGCSLTKNNVLSCIGSGGDVLKFDFQILGLNKPDFIVVNGILANSAGKDFEVVKSVRVDCN